MKTQLEKHWKAVKWSPGSTKVVTPVNQQVKEYYNTLDGRHHMLEDKTNKFDDKTTKWGW